MAKWANFLISAVRYSPDHKFITELLQHDDLDDSVSDGIIVKREEVSDAIKKGKKYRTIYNSSDNWKIGDEIRTYMLDGDFFLRADKNKVAHDNLGTLPEL